MTIIKTQDLKKEYGSKGVKYQALTGIDLEVNKGEFLAIMGPSGSGKTTLLNILSTIDKPTSGKVSFNGMDLFSIKNEELAKFRRDRIGFVFQDFNLLDNMTVMDNIALPLALNKANHKDITAKVHELAGFFGIEQQLTKYPYQLSGGQKQRVAAARALIMNPSVIFADEPTGALDSKASAELLECFKRLNTNFGTTIIMVTHDAFAASYCGRIMFLKDGAIHARLDSSGSRKDLFHKILDMLGAMGGVGAHELL
ncbi:MAG: ABC transporter ATP-binding protein [Clostridia bacterium]|nr:ABC transporter ATP-binding protein [Clostridia bacterium]